MLNAQAVVGFATLVAVLIAAYRISRRQARKRRGTNRIITAAFRFPINFLLCYAALCIGGVLIWLVAWFGIAIRETIQWLAVAVLYPLSMINPF